MLGHGILLFDISYKSFKKTTLFIKIHSIVDKAQKMKFDLKVT